jgi:membrane fusion protein (multidrug efflux system)
VRPSGQSRRHPPDRAGHERTVIFTIVFVLLAAVVGGFGYFQFVMKPEMIKGMMAKSAPPTVTIATEVAKPNMDA